MNSNNFLERFIFSIVKIVFICHKRKYYRLTYLLIKFTIKYLNIYNIYYLYRNYIYYLFGK